MISLKREYSRAVVSKTVDGLQDVVTSVYCALYATDVDTNITESMGELIDLNPPVASQFISFDAITYEMIDSWVVTRDQYSQLENKLISAINIRLNPVEVIKELPFNVAPTIASPDALIA